MEKPVIGERTMLSFKIINKGLGDIRFVSVTLTPLGYALLSEPQIYIGTIRSDDFENANFDVLLHDANPRLVAAVTYEDIDGKRFAEYPVLPLNVYNEESAIALGIAKKNYFPLYAGAFIAVIIIWLIFRRIRKRNRMKRSMVEHGR